MRRIGGFSGQADINGAKDVGTISYKYDHKIMASLFHFNAYPGNRLDFSATVDFCKAQESRGTIIKVMNMCTDESLKA